MDEIIRELLELKKANLLRELNRPLSSAQGVKVKLGDRELLNFSSNDYLNLAANFPQKEALDCLKRWGVGSGASRLLTGDFEIHHELERKLAQIKKTEAALLFPSGYMANVGILQALSYKKKCAVFSDRLNHASIIDACRLSRCDVFIYGHADSLALRKLLKEARDKYQRLIIVTDSVFSMDGDLAPLDELLRLSEEFSAYLVIDDAHATGVVGYSSFDVFNLKPTPRTVIMGTLGKALGTQGAFAASSGHLIELMVNRARAFIYTTALSPFIACLTLKNLKLVPERMKKLKENIKFASKLFSLKRLSAIFPVIVGRSERALELSNYLFEAGFLVPAVRPPTVPEGTARLRISINASHSFDEIKSLYRAIESWSKEGG